MNLYRTKLSEKLKESLEAVVPIIAIVLILSFTIAPVPPGILMAFIIGAILLVVGMMFFTLGAEMSMTPMGERIGTRIAQSKRLPVIIGLCFVLGFIITISEPDLQVLAGQVPSVSNMTLILAVAVGVGIFLVAAVLRMLFSKPLSYMLLIFYPVVFILTFFVSKDFLAIAFDSGGVTTGPMTVPFIMHWESDSLRYVVINTQRRTVSVWYRCVRSARCWRYCFLVLSIIHRVAAIPRL